MGDKVYSADGQVFHEDGVGELFGNMMSDGQLTVGQKYYSGTKIKRDPSYYFSVDTLLEDMGATASDDAGEFADGFPDLSEDKKAELGALVGAWLNANMTVDFFTVKEVVEHLVTEEDIQSLVQP